MSYNKSEDQIIEDMALAMWQSRAEWFGEAYVNVLELPNDERGDLLRHYAKAALKTYEKINEK